MRPLRLRRGCLLPAVGAVVLGAARCEDSRRLPGRAWRAETRAVTVDGKMLDEKAAPREVACALLAVLEQSVEVRRDGLGEPARLERFHRLEAEVRSLAAPQAIFEAASHDPYHLMPADLTVERAVELVTDEWPAIVAHYARGIDLASATEQLEGSDAATVVVQAGNPREQALLGEIRQSLQGQRDARGRGLRPGTALYVERLRNEAIARGVPPRASAAIRIVLARENGFWRVVRLTTEPGAALDSSKSIPPTSALPTPGSAPAPS